MLPVAKTQPDLSSVVRHQGEFLPFSRPTLSQATIDEVVDCLTSGWIATGPRVKQFEDDLQAYCNSSTAIAVTSGTAGLLLCLSILGLEEGDEVITTPLTFVATLNTIVQAGGKPVLVDIDPITYNIDINKIEEKITPRTKAIIPVHFAGLAVDLDPLYKLAHKYNLRVIEDAAHSIGTKYHGRLIGGFGDMQVFSFHPNKNMTTGEGGAITCHNEKTAQDIQPLRFHGIDRAAWNRFSKQGSQHYDVVAPGHKFNMMDLQAALGLHQLAALEDFIERRNYLANRYLEAFNDWPQISLPSPGKESDIALGSRHAWHLFAILIKPEVAGLSRDEFIEAMKHHNIGTGLHYPACHLYSYYRENYGFKKGDFPHAEYVGEHIVSLPLFPTLSNPEQDQVIQAMQTIFKRA